MKGIPRTVRAAGAAAALFLAALPAAAGGFFDDVPAKSYVRDDIALDVVSAGERGDDVVARVRFLRLVLDPGRRDVAPDLWPRREMLLMEHASGARVVFERLDGLPAPTDVEALTPRGRIGLPSVAVETFARSASGPCASLDGLIRLGSVDLPVGEADLAAPTVRLGIAQAVETALDSRDVELIGDAVAVLLRAESQGLPLGPLGILDVVFPGRRFARSAASLTFRVSAAVPPNPAEPPWSSITKPPDMTPGLPAY